MNVVRGYQADDSFPEIVNNIVTRRVKQGRSHTHKVYDWFVCDGRLSSRDQASQRWKFVDDCSSIPSFIGSQYIFSNYFATFTLVVNVSILFNMAWSGSRSWRCDWFQRGLMPAWGKISPLHDHFCQRQHKKSRHVLGRPYMRYLYYVVVACCKRTRDALATPVNRFTLEAFLC
jgi:hypothetical protein